jgi:ketosteroid isomerase-like protein
MIASVASPAQIDMRLPVPLPRGFLRGSLALLVSLVAARDAAAQASAPSDSAALFATIAGRDSAMFDAFNRCDAKALADFFTDDLEFYHDWNGLLATRKAFEKQFGGACENKEIGRRELVPGTMEVHPMRNVGAVQIGVHRFFIRTPNGETPGSTAKFIQLWRNDGGVWRVSRVLSYDHRR